jgi:hypothetical protein
LQLDPLPHPLRPASTSPCGRISFCILHCLLHGEVPPALLHCNLAAGTWKRIEKNGNRMEKIQ